MKRNIGIAALAVLAIALAGCSASSTSQSGTSSASSTTASANVQACQDFGKQVAWLKARRAFLTLDDIANFGGWLVMDAGDSTGQLHKDFAALSAGYQELVATGGTAHVSDQLAPTVAADCSQLGVSVVP
jgi:hypothetical protein